MSINVNRQLAKYRINGEHTFDHWITSTDRGDVAREGFYKALQLGFITNDPQTVKVEVAAKSGAGYGFIEEYEVISETKITTKSIEIMDYKKVKLEPGTRIVDWNPWEDVILEE